MSVIGTNPDLGQVILDRVTASIREEFSDFALIPKKSSLQMCIIDVLLRIITFNRMRTFLTSYVTTRGSKVYVPETWDLKTPFQQAVTLRHERVHMQQRRRLGGFMFILRYLCWPLPFFYAKGRRDLEMEAYEESIRAMAQYYGYPRTWDARVRETIIGEFVGPSYLWMWPFRKDVERWYDSVVYNLVGPIEHAEV